MKLTIMKFTIFTKLYYLFNKYIITKKLLSRNPLLLLQKIRYYEIYYEESAIKKNITVWESNLTKSIHAI